MGRQLTGRMNGVQEVLRVDVTVCNGRKRGESQKKGAERGTLSTESGRERGMKAGRVSDEIRCERVM